MEAIFAFNYSCSASAIASLAIDVKQNLLKKVKPCSMMLSYGTVPSISWKLKIRNSPPALLAVTGMLSQEIPCPQKTCIIWFNGVFLLEASLRQA